MRLCISTATKKRKIPHLLIIGMLFAFLPDSFLGLAAADEMTQFQRARAAVNSGSFLEAESLLKDYIDSYPKGRNVLMARYLLGQLLYRGADYEGAIREFHEIINKNPEWKYADRAGFGIAVIQSYMLDYASATKTLEWLLVSYPESEIVPDAQYWLAEFLYRRADYDGALTQFNRFSSRHPTHPLTEYARDSIAWCLERQGQYGQAIAVREEFLKEFPESQFKSICEFLLATDYLKADDSQAALRHYLSAGSASSPTGAQALLRAGLLLIDDARIQEAINVLKELLERKPSDGILAQGGLALGYCYLKRGEYKPAEEVAQALLAMSSDDAHRCVALFQLALAQTGLGNRAEAAKNLSIIVRQDICSRIHDRSIMELARCLIDLDQPDAAAEEIISFTQRRKPAESSDAIFLTLAGSLIRAHRIDEALDILAELSKSGQVLSTSPEIVYLEGLCLSQKSQHARAAQRFDQFIRTNGSSEFLPLAAYMEANSLLAAGNIEKATHRYGSFLKNWPDDKLVPLVLYQSGLANLLLDRCQNASEDFEKALRSPHPAPISTAARYFLGISRMKAGDFEGAVGLFRTLLDNSPDFEFSDRAAYAWGWIEFTRKDYRMAEEAFSRIIAMFPHSPLVDRAHFYGAASKYKAGQLADAAQEFEAMTALFPNSPLNGEASLWAGICSEKMQQPDRALKLYGNALQLGSSPNVRAEALYAVAWTELGLADDAAAIVVIDKLIDEFPRSALAEQAYLLRGRLNYGKRLWEPASRDLLTLSTAFPASELADDALFFAARATRNSADYTTAAALFQELPVRFQDSPLIEHAEIERAECLIEAGNADAAAREFEQFIKNNLDSPLRPLALFDMGKALQRAGDFEAAIEQYRAASGDETTELAARSRFAIAECLAELDRSGEAVAELIKISQGRFPPGWAERAQLQIARLLERDSQMEEARQVYLSVAAGYGDDAAGMVALKAIDRLDREMQETGAR